MTNHRNYFSAYDLNIDPHLCYFRHATAAVAAVAAAVAAVAAAVVAITFHVMLPLNWKQKN